MKKYCVIITLLLSFCFTSFLYAENDKYFLEKHYTDLVQVMLNSMFGPGNFVARVKVDMTDPNTK